MKKTLIFIALLLIALTIVGCKSATPAEKAKDKMVKILESYFDGKMDAEEAEEAINKVEIPEGYLSLGARKELIYMNLKYINPDSIGFESLNEKCEKELQRLLEDLKDFDVEEMQKILKDYQ